MNAVVAVSNRIAEGTIINTNTNEVPRSIFQIGDRVVHPQHGIGQIVKLEDREFERGITHRYYEIHLPGGGTIWVPVDLSNSGLRRLAHKSELAQCREILQARPLPLTEDGRIRHSDLVARLKQGTIAAQCEVVRDVSAHIAQKPSYGALTAFLEAMLRALCQEWAIVEETTMAEAMTEISSLLEKRKM